ncbi:MAG: hypothetical protein JW984_16500 [Deltaproteobacteria bacterium]|uniref:Uncharacterized protein n=1 Tax=Candidatus Zymogenus saltonus TaxID=2844893 RepID=A0A9D8KJT8_9DELT|nr:hypothetical protein [Candidatus Zymogenus saltonus]
MRKPFILSIVTVLTVALCVTVAISEEATAKFYVTSNDTGNKILSGLEGVKRVENGTEEGKEFNTVYYDPNIITEEEMAGALKAQNVYIGTSKLFLLDKP